MNVFFVALGANLPSHAGLPKVTLTSALDALNSDSCRVEDVSRFYATPCFPPGAGPDYVNAAARVVCDETPEAMLERLHQIEADFGRAREQRWGMRTLDLDLLAADSAVLPDRETVQKWMTLPSEAQRLSAPDQLILPHPRLQDRAFVLVPLRDIAAEWTHPVTQLTVTEMCDALPPSELAEIRPLDL